MYMKKVCSYTTLVTFQEESAAELENKLSSVNERCAALQEENKQYEKSLEELDTQHQQAVGEWHVLCVFCLGEEEENRSTDYKTNKKII